MNVLKAVGGGSKTLALVPDTRNLVNESREKKSNERTTKDDLMAKL
jgi:hypothetical protein